MASGTGREDVRIPVLTDTQINQFSVGEAGQIGSYIKNGIVSKYGNGEFFVQQRPSFQIWNLPADYSVTDIRGRGCYYHATADNIYFINDTTMYYDDYSQSMTLATVTSHSADTSDATLFTAGTQRIYPARLGLDVFWIDPENNKGKYIRGATSYTVIYDMGAGAGEHTSDDFTAFPPNNSKTLAHGAAVLDQTLYVLATDGTVWGSTLGNGKDWSSALNVITAEREEDDGVFIAKHFNEIVVFGRRTIEFFYNAGNPSGSPLSRRTDIMHNIGCADPMSVWQHGDDIYFMGIDQTGQIMPYVMRQRQIVPIGNAPMSSMFLESKAQDSMSILGGGMSTGGETYYIVSLYQLDDNSDPDATASYVYNTNSQIWTEWEFSEASLTQFPLVMYTQTDDARIGEGIMLNGQMVYARDNYAPVDTVIPLGTDPYVADGFVATDYVDEGGSGTTAQQAIEFIIRIDNWDGGNRNWKYCHQLRMVCDQTVNSQNMTVKWQDGDSIGTPDFTGTRTIDLQKNVHKLTRLGKFKSRSFEVTYSGNEQIRVKAIDLTLTNGVV